MGLQNLSHHNICKKDETYKRTCCHQLKNLERSQSRLSLLQEHTEQSYGRYLRNMFRLLMVLKSNFEDRIWLENERKRENKLVFKIRDKRVKMRRKIKSIASIIIGAIITSNTVYFKSKCQKTRSHYCKSRQIRQMLQIK